MGDPRETAARAQAQITATHRTTPGVKRGRVQTAGYTDLSATTLGVIGTAAKVGETFFGGLIAILSGERITRLDYTVQACTMALFFAQNPAWY